MKKKHKNMQTVAQKTFKDLVGKDVYFYGEGGFEIKDLSFQCFL